MVKLLHAFDRLASVKVAVIGDLMLDSYTIGKVSRISPEAPVPVLNVEKEEQRAGGAGNVMLNLLSLGANVVPIGRIGADPAGQMLKALFASEGMSIEGLFLEVGYLTIVKNRIIASSQQIVRIDKEKITPLPEMLEQQIIEALPTLLEGVQAIAISDYGKGFLSKTLLSWLIDYAKENNIPTIADPKGSDFSRYRGVDLLKPNLSELYTAVKMPSDVPIEIAAASALESSQSQALMVTRSEEGISLFDRAGSRFDDPVQIQEVRDVTGAGDTVLAMTTCAIANGLELPVAIQLSNVAASIAVSHFGCARVTLTDLAARLQQIEAAYAEEAN